MNNELPTYLDCNATTPIEPSVAEIVLRYMRDDFGNAGSRTHQYGARAKRAVERARLQVAGVVAARAEEVFFTSGATESNNLAIKGLRQHGEDTGKLHIISTGIEHKAVLGPLQSLASAGFEVELVPCDRRGWVDAGAIAERLRPETLLVSVMHVNNETGITQPITEIAGALQDHEAFFHTDAAQGFGKDLEALRCERVDLISISGHKIYGPKGVGALVARRRGYSRPPIRPLIEGGGQERGIRAGTQPVPLVAGLGLAAELSVRHADVRRGRVLALREKLQDVLFSAGGRPIGDQARCVPSTLSVWFPGVDSEAAMLMLKAVVAVSNGSACTSQEYTPSHVLEGMGLSEDEIGGALRFSWCHLTEEPNLRELDRCLTKVGSSSASTP